MGTAGCTRWTRLEQPWPATLSPRQQVQVWRDGRAEVLHGLVFTADSLRGVPFQKSLPCTDCEITVARTAVDSLRLRDRKPSGAVIIGAGIGIAALAAILVDAWQEGLY